MILVIILNFAYCIINTKHFDGLCFKDKIDKTPIYNIHKLKLKQEHQKRDL